MLRSARPKAGCAALLLLMALPSRGQAAPSSSSANRQAPLTRRQTKPAGLSTPVQPAPVAIAPLTPEELPAEAPQVSYRNGQLAIDCQNSTLTDILAAIRQQTGAQIDTPPQNGDQRAAVHLAGPPREVLASLLDGAGFGYIIVASPAHQDSIERVVFTGLQKPERLETPEQPEKPEQPERPANNAIARPALTPLPRPPHGEAPAPDPHAAVPMDPAQIDPSSRGAPPGAVPPRP